MSLLQSPRRPSSASLALGPTQVFGAAPDAGGVPTSRAFDPSRPFSAAGLDDDGPRVDLGRELDLATERPHASGQMSRGTGLLVAGIVGSSIVLGVAIMLIRGDVGQGLAKEPAAPPAITEVVTAPAEPAPAVVAPAEAAPREPPTEVATQRVASPAKAEPARPEITPAAIAPAVPTQPAAPSTSAEPAAAPAEPAGALAPGLQLPPPVFGEPEPATPEPTPAAATPGSDASDPLPGIEEPAPAPREEPGAATPEPAPDAAQPSHAATPEPTERDAFDHLPAHTARPAS